MSGQVHCISVADQRAALTCDAFDERGLPGVLLDQLDGGQNLVHQLHAPVRDHDGAPTQVAGDTRQQELADKRHSGHWTRSVGINGKHSGSAG